MFKKKISKLVLLLAAGLLAFSFMACSSDDDDDDKEEEKPETFTTYTWEVSESLSAEIDIPAATYTITASSKGTFVTKNGETEVSSGTYKVSGTTLKGTVKSEGGKDLASDKQYVLVFTIGENNVLTFTGIEAPTEDKDNSGNTYALNIDDLVAIGNVKETSKAIDSATTGVIKVWASASGKSIQAFGAQDGSLPFVKMTGGGAKTTSATEYGLELKIDANATVIIEALSKQGKTGCQWVLIPIAGGDTIESTGTPAVASEELKDAVRKQDTTPAVLTFSDVPAGTYMLGAKSDGGYLFSLKIVY